MLKYTIFYWVERNDEKVDLEFDIEAESPEKALIEFVNENHFMKIDCIKEKNINWKQILKETTKPK